MLYRYLIDDDLKSIKLNENDEIFQHKYGDIFKRVNTNISHKWYMCIRENEYIEVGRFISTILEDIYRNKKNNYFKHIIGEERFNKNMLF